MADNTILPGNGETYAADDIAGVKYQRVKLIHGDDGVNAGDVSINNPIPIAPISDYHIAVPRGDIPGVSAVRISARNSAISTTEQVLWNGAAPYNFLTAAATMRIRAGGDAADDAAGLGAREIVIAGLDDTGAIISEAVATAGASASAVTTALFRRINDFYVTEAGTYATDATAVGSNTAALLIETSGGVLLGSMSANSGTGSVGVYTVPVAKTGYLERIRCTPEGSMAVTFRLWTRKSFDDIAAPMAAKILRAEWILATEEVGFVLHHPFQLEAKEEVWVTAQTGAGASAGSAAFEIELIDD